MNQILYNSVTKLFILISFLLVNPFGLWANEKGICLIWSEGDGLTLQNCIASSLNNCSKGKQQISNKDTSFASYKGKLFKDQDGNIFEFLIESASGCGQKLIKSARDYEGTMSANWGFIVYSDMLKFSNKAYIYGEKVNVRKEPSLKGKVVFVPNNLAEVKVLDKTKQRVKITKQSYEAYWFKITNGKKTGWVYGEFIHPNPKSKVSFVSE